MLAGKGFGVVFPSGQGRAKFVSAGLDVKVRPEWEHVADFVFPWSLALPNQENRN